jgi:peptidoglycan hydrolase CwlO-like protein
MQVMVHVEPKLSGIDKELLQLREQIDMDKEYIATISAEFESYTQRIKITEVQIKEKDTQFARFHRCRLCLAENLTPRSREKFVRRTTTKRFSGANTKAEVQEEQSPEELLQASLAAQESHTSEEGKGPLLQPEN